MTDYIEKAREIAFPYRKPGKDTEYGALIDRITAALREAHQAGRMEAMEQAAEVVERLLALSGTTSEEDRIVLEAIRDLATSRGRR